MIAALILAAGKGIRFGSETLPKQFREVSGKPLFVHSIANYQSIPEVERIVVTTNPEFAEQTRRALIEHALLDHVTVIDGGDTRQASVGLGADALRGDGELTANDLVIVHNAASPNTRPAFIRECLAATDGYDAVQACVPDTRTVFERSGDLVQRVLPRAPLVYNCDPLIYRGEVFEHLLRTQRERGTGGETTTDTALELGYRIRLIESDYDNIKVTNQWDLEAVRAAMATAT